MTLSDSVDRRAKRNVRLKFTKYTYLLYKAEISCTVVQPLAMFTKRDLQACKRALQAMVH